MDAANKILIGVYVDFNAETVFKDADAPNDTLTYTAQWKVSTDADNGTY